MKNPKTLVIALIALLIGFAIGKGTLKHQPGTDNSGSAAVHGNTVNPSTAESQSSSTAEIPAKVYHVLDYVKKHHQPLEGYVGGRQFGNYEGHLPEKDAFGVAITYQEWDINPKIEGQNRGKERLVTGSDGRSWYTDDHYNSFTEVK